MGDVFANEAPPLRLRRLRDAVQEYVSQRRAMPEVREGVGEGAEPAESAAEIPTVDGGTGGQVDRESGSSVHGREFGNIAEATMTIGTRSVLYGAHCAVLHPWFLAVAWYKLYGFPWDVRLWASFCLHDIGYISKPNMDGCEGETHVELGAKIMGLLFGESWAAFTAAHSRYWAKRNGRQFSRLCVADIHVSHLSREKTVLLSAPMRSAQNRISSEPAARKCASRRCFLLFAEPDIHLLSRAPKGRHRRLSLCSLPVPKQTGGSLWSSISFAQSATCRTWQSARCVIPLCFPPAAAV